MLNAMVELTTYDAAQASYQAGASNQSTSVTQPIQAHYRIGPEAFTASIFVFLGIAIIVASYRIYLRLKTFRKLNIDDHFMIAAVVLFTASTGVTQYSRDLLYLQMSVDQGAVRPDTTFIDKMLLYTKINTVSYMLQWSAIYCVKFSYIFFFRPLTSRLRPLRIWWWMLIGITLPMALVTICLSPWVCPHYDMSFLQHCVLNGSVIVHEQIILQVSTATDITTDLLIISIPLWLLTSVKLEVKRKLALGAVLCLSVFMIVIAVIRYALCPLPLRDGSTIPDTIWLFFWQSIESCVAIIMVSLTAFRSLYGQERAKKRNDRREYEYVNDSSARARNGRSNPVDHASGLGSKNRTLVGYEEEQELSSIEKLPHARLAQHSRTDVNATYYRVCDDPYQQRKGGAFV